MRAQALLTYCTAAGRWVVFVTVLGSSIVAIDGTVVTIALPAMSADLDPSFSSLQWIITGYTLTLSALILIGGAAGDRYGRRRVFLLGVVWFGVASLLCALAPTTAFLIGARLLQGVGAALLTPASLAILESSFAKTDRSIAISAWAAFGAIAGALAPFVGGWLLALGSWRWLFLINVPLAALALVVGSRHIPEPSVLEPREPLDWTGAVLTVAFLGAGSYAIVEQSWWVAGAAAVVLAAFVFHERGTPHPLVPLGLLRNGQVAAISAVTFLVYGAITVFYFVLVLQLQVVADWSALSAGAATIPAALLTLLLGRRTGRLAQRVGARLPIAIGSLSCAVGSALALRIDSDASYPQVLTATSVLGLGIALLVPPLTSTAFSAVPARHVGLASGFNHAVARTASLVAIAAVPGVVGLHGQVLDDADRFARGYMNAMAICILLFSSGALCAWVGVDRPLRQRFASQPMHAEAGFEPHCAIRHGLRMDG
jgi:EmrB/QacA subfamily drug resistance transporter